MVPAGSFGRRTLVRGSFDVDLLVFVNEFKKEPTSSFERLSLDDDGQLRRMRRQVGRPVQACWDLVSELACAPTAGQANAGRQEAP